MKEKIIELIEAALEVPAGTITEIGRASCMERVLSHV